jgi:hypothetical protein
MPVFLIIFVEGLLGPKFGKFAKPLTFVVLGLLILLALWGGKCAYDSSVINAHEAKIEQRAKPATDKAAQERSSDIIANAKNEQEMHNAIAAQPDQPISPTSHALSCQRLRNAGHNPPACR